MITFKDGTSVPPADVQTFLTPGAFVGGWVKPAGAKYVRVISVGGGGGGGSGGRGATNVVRTGGAGGSGGGYTDVTLPASLLGATETVTVAAR